MASTLKLVREYFDKFESKIVEEEKQKKYYIQGTTIQCEVVNGNNRFYRKSPTAEGIQRHMDEYFSQQRAVGELNHPKENGGRINPENISHRFVDVREDGNNYWTKALILDTPKGKIVKSLLDGGVRLGISSRGLADLSEENGIQYIEKYYVVSLGDIVFNPSAPDAFVQGVFEEKEWIYENGLFIEKDIEPQMIEWKKRFKNMSSKDYHSVTKNVFEEYLKTLGLNSK